MVLTITGAVAIADDMQSSTSIGQNLTDNSRGPKRKSGLFISPTVTEPCPEEPRHCHYAAALPPSQIVTFAPLETTVALYDNNLILFGFSHFEFPALPAPQLGDLLFALFFLSQCTKCNKHYQVQAEYSTFADFPDSGQMQKP